MSERMTDWPREIALLKAERDALREQVWRVQRFLESGRIDSPKDPWERGWNEALRAAWRGIDQ